MSGNEHIHAHDHQHNHAHHHCHDHAKEHSSPGEAERQWWRNDIAKLIAAAILLAGGWLLPGPEWFNILLFALAWLPVGAEVLWQALTELLSGAGAGEDFLMSVASLGAFAIGEYPEAVAVMLLFQLGELLQDRAVDKSRHSIAALLDLRPDHANLLDSQGRVSVVSPQQVAVGQNIQIKPGERIPLDCRVLSGHADLDTSALTGEAAPRPVGPGQLLISGCVNINGLLTAEVVKEYGQSTVSRILQLTQQAADKKARTENFITRFARIYTPLVVGGAALLAIIPPLLFSQPWSVWIYRALTLLVISCPCALVISVPLTFFAGIGGAGRSGVLVKGGNYLEMLARTELALFDKTGTLTEGGFEVEQLFPAPGVSWEQLLELAALAEAHSPHPLAASIIRAYGRPVDETLISAAEEIPGYGLQTTAQGRQIWAGNQRLMEKLGHEVEAPEQGGSIVYIATDQGYCGCLTLFDQLKPHAAQAISDLRSLGIKTALLSGDRQQAAQRVGSELGLDAVYAELLPEDKVACAERLLSERSATGALVYIGDGVNDAPVLARADVGLAMGRLGSDAAIEAADIVIMNDDPLLLAPAILQARRVMRIVRQNIIFSLAIKVVFLALGALGLAAMWAAVFADVGVALLATANAMRALKV